MTLDQIKAIISGMENGIKTDTIFSDLRAQKSHDAFERMYNELYANLLELKKIAIKVDAKFEIRINAIIKALELEKIKALISTIKTGLNIIKTDLRAQKNHAAFEERYNEIHTHLQQLKTDALNLNAKSEDVELIDTIIEELDGLATEKLEDYGELKKMEADVPFLLGITDDKEFSEHHQEFTENLKRFHLQKTLSTRTLTTVNKIEDNLDIAKIIRDIKTSSKRIKENLLRKIKQASDLQTEVDGLQSELDELEIAEGHELKDEADALHASLTNRMKQLESLINNINNSIKQIDEIVENISKDRDADSISEQHRKTNKIGDDLTHNKKSIDYDREQLKILREKLLTSFQKNKGSKKSKAHAVEEQAPAAEKVKFQSAKKPLTKAGNEVVIAAHRKAPKPSDSTQAVDDGETAKLAELMKLVEAFKILKPEIPSDESLYTAIDASNIVNKEYYKNQMARIFKYQREMIDRAITNIESVISGVNNKEGSVEELIKKIMEEKDTGLSYSNFSKILKNKRYIVQIYINRFKKELSEGEEVNHLPVFPAINADESLISELQEAENDVVIEAHRKAPKPLDNQGANAEEVKFQSAKPSSTEAENTAHSKPSVAFNYSTHFSAMRHAAKIIAGFTLMLAGAALMAFSATHLNLVVFSIGMAAAYAGVVLIADGSIDAKSSFRDDDKANDSCVCTSKP